MSGFTKRSRATCDSEIFLFKPDKRFKIRFYIVGAVQWKDYKKRERGSNWFTYDEIGAATGASKQQIRKCVTWMKKTGMIETFKETRGITIKVLNYAKYQDIKKEAGDGEEIQGRYGGDTEEDTIEEEEKKKEIKNNNSVIEKSKKPPNPKPKKAGPTWQQKESVIQEIKRKVEAYGMVYDSQQDKDFAAHILSGKMTKIAAQYGYMSPLPFLLSVIDMSMQDLKGSWLEKRWRYKVNGPKILYQKYAEICADYQNSTNGKTEGIKKF